MIVQLRLRGAIILAVGFSLGYAKAVRDSEEISRLLRELIEELKHFPQPETTEDSESEVVVEAIEVPAEEVPEPAQQGETP